MTVRAYSPRCLSSILRAHSSTRVRYCFIGWSCKFPNSISDSLSRGSNAVIWFSSASLFRSVSMTTVPALKSFGLLIWMSCRMVGEQYICIRISRYGLSILATGSPARANARNTEFGRESVIDCGVYVGGAPNVIQWREVSPLYVNETAPN